MKDAANCQEKNVTFAKSLKIMKHQQLVRELQKLGDVEQAAVLQRYFKTQEGEYGHGDVFWGIRVPQIRRVVKTYIDLNLREIEKLLSSDIHELRTAALLILVQKFTQAQKQSEVRQEIFDFYLSHLRHINNWDLVDVSSHYIVGEFLKDKDRTLLYRLAKSDHLWTQRVAVISTYAFIRQGETEDIFAIGEMLFNHSHDLMHKAVGWMLREAGKRNKSLLTDFLYRHASKMPRTTLRYAIEKFSDEERKAFLRIKREK
jgi:3-methyladenine DNA glycosylase AlkD